jgi:glycosyltransferase involved in cell wall biosynthesis
MDKNKLDYRFIKMDFSKDMQDMGSVGLKKMFRLGRIFFSILWALFTYKPTHVYYPPAGNTKVPVFRDFVLLFPVRLLRYKIIFHFYAGGISEIYHQLSAFWKPVFRFVYYKADYSICLSEFGKKDPLALQSSRILVVPSGVDDPQPQLPITKPADICTVLFMAVCRESKGILDFIQVIEKCNRVNPKITGIVTGEIFSNKEEQAISQAVKKGIITYAGTKSGKEKHALFSSVHCLLFPSFFEAENFPTVILDAFSFGVPVVATRWRGIPDLVTDTHNGFLHNLHDIDGMISSILQLAGNETLFQTLSANARRTYEEKYTSEIFEHAIVTQFNALV